MPFTLWQHNKSSDVSRDLKAVGELKMKPLKSCTARSERPINSCGFSGLSLARRRRPEQRWRWRHRRLRHDVTLSWDEQPRSAAVGAGTKMLGVDPRGRAASTAGSLLSHKCRHVASSERLEQELQLRSFRVGFFLFSQPQDSLRVLQRLKDTSKRRDLVLMSLSPAPLLSF